VAHRVDGPRVFDDEEGNPLPLLYVDEVDAADRDRDRVDDEKGDVELHLMPRGGQIVGDVQKPIFGRHVAIVTPQFSNGKFCGV